MENTKEVDDDYQKRIVELVMNIHNEKFLKMIYGFTKALYEESAEV